MRTRKGPCISQGESAKAIKEMRDEKCTGDKGISGDVLRSLVDGLRLMSTDLKTYMKPASGTRISLKLK
jgi:hypothetical protein